MEDPALTREFAMFSQDLVLITTRVVVAAILGGLVGLERELNGKAAGLRTNMLICVGAAAFTLVSRSFLGGDGPVDVTRIAAQIVTGIGFIGAGTIIQARGEVHGLTTAATIWVVAAIGLAAGAGFYSLAFVTTGLVLLALLFLGYMETWLGSVEEIHRYSLTVTNAPATLEKIDDLLERSGIRIHAKKVHPEDDHALIRFAATAPGSRHRKLRQALEDVPEVHKITRS